MGHLSKLAALGALSAAAILAASCGADRAPPAEEPVNESTDALQSTDEGPTGEAAQAQDWGDRWRYCYRWRDCVYRYGRHACYRWNPQLGYYCSYFESPYPPGGGYPPYPPGPGGGGYPPYPPGGGPGGGGEGDGAYPSNPPGPGGGPSGGGYPPYPPGPGGGEEGGDHHKGNP